LVPILILYNFPIFQNRDAGLDGRVISDNDEFRPLKEYSIVIVMNLIRKWFVLYIINKKGCYDEKISFIHSYH
jgi:hypothetical protein